MHLGRRKERWLLFALLLTAALQGIGIAMMNLEASQARIGRIALAIGAVLFMVFVATTRRVEQLHSLSSSGGTEYDELRGRGSLRAMGLTLNAFWILALVLLAVCLLYTSPSPRD